MDYKGTRHSDYRKYDPGQNISTAGNIENMDQTRSQNGMELQLEDRFKGKGKL
jgi:hypothetical protein